MCCLKSQTQSVWGHFMLAVAHGCGCSVSPAGIVLALKSQCFQQSVWLSSLRFIPLCFQKVEDVQHNRRVHRTLPKDQTQLLSLQHDHKQRKKEPSKSSNSAGHPPSSSTSKEVLSWPMKHFGALQFMMLW